MDKLMDNLGSGWKTTVSGILTILLGVAGLGIKLLAPESEVALAVDIQVSMGLITAGLAILGVGHKVEMARREAREERETDRRFMEGK